MSSLDCRSSLVGLEMTGVSEKGITEMSGGDVGRARSLDIRGD